MSEPYGNQKPKTYNKQKIEKSKHNTKTSHQMASEKREKKNREESYKNNQKTGNKVAINTYILIITVNVPIKDIG